MYLGRQQLGTWLDSYLQVVNANKTPLMPDAVPTIKIRRASDNAVVYSGLMPVVDKVANVGLFCSRLFLGSGYSVGYHDVEMFYVAGGAGFTVIRNFEVMPAGDAKGQVLSMAYCHFPQAEFVVYQTEAGLILRGKSPRLN